MALLKIDEEIPKFLLENGWKHLKGELFNEETLKGMKLEPPFTPKGSWDEKIRKKNKGASHDIYQKGKIWIDIEENWDKLYSSSKPYTLRIKDMSKAFYCNGGFIGWMGMDQLVGFDKKPTIEYLKMTLKHLEII